jgi:MFS family permease
MLGLITILGEADMQSWGWRLPFLIAGPLGLIGMYLRSRVSDTPVFEELEDKHEVEASLGSEFKDLFVGYWPQILKLFGLVIALNVVNYTLLSYMPTYLAGSIGLNETEVLVVPIIGMLIMMLILPAVGALSDVVGRKPMWIASLVGLAVLAVPMYKLMATSLAGAIIGFLVLGLLYTPQLATISATFPAMFPAPVRFAGLAISYNVATSMFGGTAPLANERLIAATGDQLWPAYYMIGACLIGLLAVFFMIETKGASVRGTEIPGTPESIEETGVDPAQAPA